MLSTLLVIAVTLLIKEKDSTTYLSVTFIGLATYFIVYAICRK